MMPDADDMKRYSLAQIEGMEASGDYVPTRPDAPAVEIDEGFWRVARVVHPAGPKVHTGIRLDADMLDWFKSQGRGWQTRINKVLRSYMDAHRPR